ncbi:intersectin-1-like [Denticeps clupeoides]|uniref:intersectin-1-like n=1 Tax=Denticeps clupeoides TaxID=299321 RepID=UPI0010A40B1C|nr:intersectin-1-like [Denticeps clupeoides]
MAQFPFGGGMDVWVISSDERAKHDQQFLGLSPTPSGYITGDQGRNFFLQSGLPPPVLAQIWALADLNSDGRMDRHEFSIAMKLIMLKLQGFHLPPSLPPSLKQPPLPRLPHTPRGGSPVSRLGLSPPFPLSTVTNGAPSVIPPITEPPHTGVKPSSPRLPHGAKSGLVPLSERPSSPASPPSADWAVPQSSRLKYRQLFNSHDKLMIGHLTGAQARAVLMQSNLPQSQLATIWDLCDVDKDGRLAGEEFILAMHLIDMAMTGQPLPHTLSSDLIPPTFRKGSAAVPPISSQTRSQQPPVEDVEDEEWAEKKLPVTLEDRKRENFERGSAALEKRRQALEEQQREERERWEALEREEAERRERERAEQERRRQQELEKQREEERRREEQRRKEMEQREAAQREELFIQRRREQQRVAELRTQRNTLQNQLQALCEKRHLLEGKLKDVRFRLSAWKIEIENINQTREQRITEIIHLQQQLQGCQQWLGSLIPDKQHLNEQLRHTQLNSLQNNTLVMLQKAVELKLSSRQHLCDQLETVEHETRSKLLEIEAFNTQLKELREIHSRQQRTREQRLAPAVPPLAWMKRVSEEAERLADLHFIQQPEPGTPPAQSTLAGITQDKVRVVSFRALYPFNARSQDEISIQPGDIITVKVDLVDEDHVGAMGWLDGELKGKTGWFPANYTERLPDGDVPPELRPSTPSSSSSSSSSSSTASKPSASVASTEGFQATPTEARQAPPPIPVDSTPPPCTYLHRVGRFQLCLGVG